MALGERSATWFEGRWHDGNTPILGSADHGTWQGTLVFDGARAFEGVTPDLDRHCARVVASAEAMGLGAPMGAAEIEARARGFSNALSLDQAGHVAETASSNVFMVRDGAVMTPAANGTFLNGITRQRIVALLRADGVGVAEASLTVEDFAAADEIFLTGNASKVVPVTRFESREIGAGPMAARAWSLYRDFAHQARRAA